MVEAMDTDILLQDNEADVNKILYTDETYASSDEENDHPGQLNRKILLIPVELIRSYIEVNLNKHLS